MHVVDLILKHGNTLQAYAKSKSLVLVRIDAAHLQYMRMYHAAAEDLNPSLTLAHPAALAAALEAGNVYLCAWLREREVMRAELNLRVLAEKLTRELCKCALQICEGDMFVNYQSLNLMEIRRMCRIQLVSAEYASRSDHADRQLSLFHGVYLYAGSLRTQKDILCDIEGILLILGRVVCRNIECLKIIIILLNFRTVNNLITHTDKNTLNFLQRNTVRMSVAETCLFCGKCYINGL